MNNLVATISEAVSAVTPNAKIGYDIAFPNIGIFKCLTHFLKYLSCSKVDDAMNPPP